MASNERPTQGELHKRRQAVYEMILLGVSRAGILQLIVDKYDVSESTVDNYIAYANKQIKEITDPQLEDNYQVAIGRLQLLFQKNMKIQDYKAALATQKEINTLQNLYPAKKHEIAGRDGGAIEVQHNLPTLPDDTISNILKHARDKSE